MVAQLQMRVDEATNRKPGVHVPNGIERLMAATGPQSNPVHLQEWHQSGITKVMIGALSELAFNPPVVLPPDAMTLQYGITLGLQLAERMLRDPTSLFPHLFIPAAPEMPASDYNHNPDGTPWTPDSPSTENHA
jgi:hypothetical protein